MKKTISVGRQNRDSHSLGTVAEVSAYLRVPVATLYRWRYQGVGPPASRVGKHLRYRWRDVEAWLDQQGATDGA